MRLLSTAAVIALLAACGQPATTSTTTPVETTATVTAPANTSAITAEGWGPLHVGMTRAEVTAAVGDTATPDAATEAGGTCNLYHPTNAPDGVFVMIEQDRLTSIVVRNNNALKTDRGFGIGDTASAVKAAYGASAQSIPHRYVEGGEYITVWSAGAPATPATFVTNANARGVRYETNAQGMITAVHAGGPSIQNVEGCS